MDNSQWAKVERYFRNSQKFLYGLGPGNQERTYKWLKSNGVRLSREKPPYDQAVQELLTDHGIEWVARELIAPLVRKNFREEALDYLRTCWNAGTKPDMAVLRHFGISLMDSFVEVNRQYDFVERWGDLAGVWFEEIEPLVKG